MKNKIFIFFGIIASIILTSFILYFKQAEFTSVYDPSYWKDRFEHSQWVLPLSRRDMGDDGIYAYAGYRMMHGASVEETNANKPPVGLYLIGASISIFKNQNIIIFIIGILSLFIFYLINLYFIKDKTLSLLTTILLAVNPMYFSHMYVSLLDLIQTFFLLCNVLTFIYCLKSKKYSLFFALLSGMFLGLFAETKPPILIFIGIFEAGYFLYKRKIKEILSLGFSFIAFIILPYFRYFQNGHNIFDYFKLHKYMASIYYGATNEIHRLSLLQAILLGKFPDISDGKLVAFSDWWIVLPIIWIGGLIALIYKIFDKKSDLIIKGLGIFTIITLILFSNVSSYPRYLLVIFPFVIAFFSLVLLKFFKSLIAKTALSLIILLGLFNAYFYLLPNPESTLKRFYHNISSGLFQDIYRENIINPENSKLSQDEFRKMLLLAYHQANIVSVDFKEKKRLISENKTAITVDVTYFTREIGSFTEEKQIYLQKDKEKWWIIWDWNYVMNGYKPGFTFYTKMLPGKRGSIIDSSGNISVQDTEGYLISIDPSKIDKSREEKMLKTIEKITKINSAAILNNYVENPIDGMIYPIGTNFYKWSDKNLEALQAFPEIINTPHSARVYDSLDSSIILKNTAYYDCCTKIYSPYSYHAVLGIEKDKDKILTGANGGVLRMMNKEREIVRTIVNSVPKNGKDVVLF